MIVKWGICTNIVKFKNKLIHKVENKFAIQQKLTTK